MVHPQSNLQLSAELKLELIVQHFQTLIWYWPTISLRPGPVELQNTAMERTCGWTWFRHVSAIEMISTSLPWIGRRWPGRDPGGADQDLSEFHNRTCQRACESLWRTWMSLVGMVVRRDRTTCLAFLVRERLKHHAIIRFVQKWGTLYIVVL